jgi:hypothetical protein
MKEKKSQKEENQMIEIVYSAIKGLIFYFFSLPVLYLFASSFLGCLMTKLPADLFYSTFSTISNTCSTVPNI